MSGAKTASDVAVGAKKGQAGRSARLEELAKLPPWEQYFQLNSHFTRHGQFIHVVAYLVDDRRILAMVPHPMWVSEEKLAKASQTTVDELKRRKLKDIAD